MPTTTDASDIMRPVLDTARVGQDAWQGTIRAWTEFGQRFWPTLLSVPSPSGNHSGSVAEMMDMSFECARRLLDVQAEWARAMVDSAEPILNWHQAEPTKPQRPTRASGEKSSA